MTWDGDDYQRRFDALAASGMDVHGEAGFVMRFAPTTVLDAGCGTGRVAVELDRRGCTVVGVDADPSMLATARARGSDVEWLLADLTDFDLDRSFDVVVMAGNVPLFTPAGTQAALVAGCARHVATHGTLVSGFQLGRGYTVAEYDAHCRAGGLELAGRYATWDGDEFSDAAEYAVSVHRPHVAEPRG
jgi:SAM-dependent methyltransferase